MRQRWQRLRHDRDLQNGSHTEIAQMIEQNDLRVSNLAERFGAKRILVDELRAIDPELDSLINVNRVDDYNDLLRKIADDDR